MDTAVMEVCAIDWVRHQCTITLRASTPETIDPDAIRLARLDPAAPGDPAEPPAPGDTGRDTMPPTHLDRDDDGEVRARFNVMVGPGLDPLAPGVWTLAHVDDSGIPRPIDVQASWPAGAVDLERVWRLRRSSYRVVPSVGDGRLSLTVTHEPTGGWAATSAARPVGRLRSVARRASRAARRAAREALPTLAWRSGRRNGRRVVFATSSGQAALRSNLLVVHDRMVERGLDREFELVVIGPWPGGMVPGWTRRSRSLHRLASLRVLASADIVLVAGSRLRIVFERRFADDVRFIQLWHASGAFKTVGYSRIGKRDGLDPWLRVHKGYSHALVSSDHDVPFYAEAFGIPESRVLPIGIPRMDRFFDARGRQAGERAAHAAFPDARGRMTILFAPTYRGPASDAFYPTELIDFAALHELAVRRDAYVIFKMHPAVKRPVPIPEAFRDRITDGTRTDVDVNDLLFAVDLLITDYSSIVFEYSVLLRPMLFFAYDLEEYTSSRDFYVPFRSFVPGRIVATFDELLDAIRRDDYEVEKVADFATRHFGHLDSGATDRVIDQLILARSPSA